MILKSKLSKTSYVMANPDVYLSGDTDGLDLVFAGRLAAFAKAYNIKIVITDGYRSYEDQVKMYEKYKRGELQSTAAIPGTSWHGSRLAIDTSTQPIRKMTSSQLAKYGLCKPLSKEGWHIQPIETANMGSKCNTSLSPIDLSSQLKTKFSFSDNTILYLEEYEFAESLFEGLLSGKKDFSDSTVEYIKSYEYGEELIKKLGIV